MEFSEEKVLEENIKKLTVDILNDRDDREDCTRLGINYTKAANPTKEIIEKARSYAITLITLLMKEKY